MSTRAWIHPVVGKLQGWVRIHRSLDRMTPPGWFIFDAAILRFVSLPKEGERIFKEHWRGVWIRFSFWIPFDRA